ncbi:hypothetical protein [Bosea sp. BK604]|uniref:hypothetical protein n=1 Tax=Bosea sp. BK604 TaxID=2512180 RepID=UPI001045D8BF|nr:hypothetical protein [Bosea sp. BK604]TCR61177.1 hypothetical protein EV560_114131 [Bosea sp. BK604]
MSATLAARAHTNATLSAPPVRRSQPARRKTSWLGQVWRAALRRPGRSLVLFLFAGAAMAIAMNALVFQKVRHPAPIAAVPAPVSPPARPAELRLEQSAAAPEAAPAAVMPAAVPRPPVRPVERQQTAAREAAPRPPAPVAAAAPRSAPAVQPASAPAPAARNTAPRDPIADLINGDMRPPAEIRGVAAARPAAPRRSAEN